MKRATTSLGNTGEVSRQIDNTAYDTVKIVADNIDEVTAIGELIETGELPVDTTDFDNNLSSADDTIQKAFDTLDNLSISGDMLAANNLSDLDDVPTALVNIGLDNVDNTSDATKVLARYDTGIKKGGIVTLNTDISKVNIEATEYTIQGVDYSYAGITAYSPDLQVGQTARRLGLDASGLVDQAGKFTDAQKQTILPLSRMQAPSGQSGFGSDLLAPMHTHYYIGEEGWRKRLWHEKVIGILYSNGGVISENGTPLHLNESAGLLYNGQGHEVIVDGGSDLSGVEVYHVGGSWDTQDDATIAINTTQYDNGTDLVALSNNKWAMHTLLRSPKEDGEFFIIISQAQYASQADAEAVPPDYGFFQSQSFSGLVAVAQIIIQKSDTSITQIKDARPFIGGNVGATLGTANLQQTLDNSTDPEMAMLTTLTFKEGTDVATVDVIEVTDFADTQVFAVTGEGNVTLSGTLDGRDIDTDGTKLDGIATGADVTSANETSHSDVLVDGDVGTTANKIVQLNGSAQLPAVDGSLLTGLSSGFADPMTTIGDIIFRNGSNVTARLPIGTTGQVVGTSDGVNISFVTPSGSGDMLISTYDPQTISGDAFDTDNHTDGTTNKVYTATEKTKLSTVATNADVTSANETSHTNVVVDGSYVHTDNNLTNTLKTNYDTAYSHSQASHADTDADNTASNETSHSDVVVDGDIGSTVQAYDADTAKTDVAQTFTVSQRGTQTVDNDGSFDMDVTNRFKCTPSGNFTLTFTNIASQGGSILLDNSGGHTISAHANTKVSSTLLATISTAGIYVIAYESDSANVYVTGSQGLT